MISKKRINLFIKKLKFITWLNLIISLNFLCDTYLFRVWQTPSPTNTPSVSKTNMCLFITEHRVSNWPWPGTGRLQLCHGRHLIRHNLQVLPGHTRADPDQREHLRAHESRPKGPTGREANRPRLWGCHVWRWRQWLQCPQGRPCRNLAVGGGGVRGRALHLQGN